MCDFVSHQIPKVRRMDVDFNSPPDDEEYDPFPSLGTFTLPPEADYENEIESYLRETQPLSSMIGELRYMDFEKTTKEALDLEDSIPLSHEKSLVTKRNNITKKTYEEHGNNGFLDLVQHNVHSYTTFMNGALCGSTWWTPELLLRHHYMHLLVATRHIRFEMEAQSYMAVLLNPNMDPQVRDKCEEQLVRKFVDRPKYFWNLCNETITGLLVDISKYHFMRSNCTHEMVRYGSHAPGATIMFRPGRVINVGFDDELSRVFIDLGLDPRQKFWFDYFDTLYSFEEKELMMVTLKNKRRNERLFACDMATVSPIGVCALLQKRGKNTIVLCVGYLYSPHTEGSTNYPFNTTFVCRKLVLPHRDSIYHMSVTIDYKVCLNRVDDAGFFWTTLVDMKENTYIDMRREYVRRSKHTPLYSMYIASAQCMYEAFEDEIWKCSTTPLVGRRQYVYHNTNSPYDEEINRPVFKVGTFENKYVITKFTDEKITDFFQTPDGNFAVLTCDNNNLIGEPANVGKNIYTISA